MGKYIDADLLREEIEKRKVKHQQDYESGDTTEFHRIVEDDAITRIIDSLQEVVDLENEIRTYFQGWRNGDDFYQALNAEGECVCVEEVIGIARHFYELGRKDGNNLALKESEEVESEEESDIPVPKTVDEAVSTLGRILSDEDREYLLENGAVSMHNSLGRWIRNEWGLWTGSELKDELIKKGFGHPDDMSNYIIEEFIKYWNSKEKL